MNAVKHGAHYHILSHLQYLAWHCAECMHRHTAAYLLWTRPCSSSRGRPPGARPRGQHTVWHWHKHRGLPNHQIWVRTVFAFFLLIFFSICLSMPRVPDEQGLHFWDYYIGSSSIKRSSSIWKKTNTCWIQVCSYPAYRRVWQCQTPPTTITTIQNLTLSPRASLFYKRALWVVGTQDGLCYDFIVVD